MRSNLHHHFCFIYYFSLLILCNLKFSTGKNPPSEEAPRNTSIFPKMGIHAISNFLEVFPIKASCVQEQARSTEASLCNPHPILVCTQERTSKAEK